jgi:MFS transporter, NNP family, nitrate/nitrite transporter
VAVTQLLVPFAIGVPALALFVSFRQARTGLFLQNAGLMWIPFILLAAACAWLFMDNLKVSRSGSGSRQ